MTSRKYARSFALIFISSLIVLTIFLYPVKYDSFKVSIHSLNSLSEPIFNTAGTKFVLSEKSSHQKEFDFFFSHNDLLAINFVDLFLDLVKKLKTVLARVIGIFSLIIGIPFSIAAWCWQLTQPKILTLDVKILFITEKYIDKVKCYIYSGKAEIPIKVYEGDSKSMYVKIKSSSLKTITNNEASLMSGQDKVFLSLDMSQSQTNQLGESLEIEVLAAGFIIDGSKQQNQSLSFTNQTYRWNCYFENSGNHGISFIFRVIPANSEAIEIGVLEHAIKVVKLGNLTKLQVWQIASLFGVVGTVASLIGLPALLQQIPQILNG